MRFTCDKGQMVWNEYYTEEDIINIIKGKYNNSLIMQKRISTYYNNIFYIVVIYGKKKGFTDLGVVNNKAMKVFLSKYRSNNSRHLQKFAIAIDTNTNTINIDKLGEFYQRYWKSNKRTFPDGS